MMLICAFFTKLFINYIRKIRGLYIYNNNHFGHKPVRFCQNTPKIKKL